MKYREQDLERLHTVLYQILAQIDSICKKHSIPYFIQGGSAIGAFYNKGIVPWDDDIDVGMTRDNYNRFLEVAPAELGDKYFLEWFGTEENTPFYFAKVKVNNTLFVEDIWKNMDIHHGIFIDIFPYDRVPDNKFCQKIHRLKAKFWINCFIGKEIWIWRHCGECKIDTPLPKSWISCAAIKAVCSVMSRKAIYNKMCRVLGRYNNKDTEYVNIVRMPKDQIRRKYIENPVNIEFGGMQIPVPDCVEEYLRHHYPNLRPVLPVEEQINHAPYKLDFGSEQ